jgi:hypothetical protein
MNTTQTIASISGALVVGLIAGYFLRPQQDIDCTLCPCPKGTDIVNKTLDEAIGISNFYRVKMDYCPIPPSTDIKIHQKEGYFEITKAGLLNLNTAVEKIISETPAPAP